MGGVSHARVLYCPRIEKGDALHRALVGRGFVWVAVGCMALERILGQVASRGYTSAVGSREREIQKGSGEDEGADARAVALDMRGAVCKSVRHLA
jgi:hypothetical protein